MTEVVATRVGIYGGRVREVGERFTLHRPEDMGSWMAPAESDEAAATPRLRENRGSPVRALSGPNEALAYAEAGDHLTSLRLQLRDALTAVANLTLENQRLAARLEQVNGGTTETRDDRVTAAQIVEAQKANRRLVDEAAKLAVDADFRKSEDEAAVEAAADKEAREASEAEAKAREAQRLEEEELAKARAINEIANASTLTDTAAAKAAGDALEGRDGGDAEGGADGGDTPRRGRVRRS